MQAKKRTTYEPAVISVMTLELEQGFAAESATVAPNNPGNTSNQPEVTDWKTGSTIDQTFEL
ncbi:MAG: hypothetical protein K0R59_71 [Sphingobacterium sp.]|jgi:hypothetical protein|nr:hypothetical protein [Sphingobacterium sp.]